MMNNCDNCIFREQRCEKENKCQLFKEDTELKEEPEEIGKDGEVNGQGDGYCSMRMGD